MKLKGYRNDWVWNSPDAREYYERWVKQYPNADASKLVVKYVADHDPFMELLMEDEAPAMGGDGA